MEQPSYATGVFTPLRVTVVLVVFVLLGLLMVARKRHDRLAGEFSDFRRDAVAALRQDLMGRDSALQVGDDLPELRVIGSRIDTTDLRALHFRGVRYFYLQRAECPLCQELEPALVALRLSASDSFAIIAYQNGIDMAPQGDGVLRYELPGVPWTPSLGVLSDLEVAHGYTTAVQSGVQG